MSKRPAGSARPLIWSFSLRGRHPVCFTLQKLEVLLHVAISAVDASLVPIAIEALGSFISSRLLKGSEGTKEDACQCLARLLAWFYAGARPRKVDPHVA